MADEFNETFVCGPGLLEVLMIDMKFGRCLLPANVREPGKLLLGMTWIDGHFRLVHHLLALLQPGPRASWGISPVCLFRSPASPMPLHPQLAKHGLMDRA